jgi:hypothetical protein
MGKRGSGIKTKVKKSDLETISTGVKGHPIPEQE